MSAERKLQFSQNFLTIAISGDAKKKKKTKKKNSLLFINSNSNFVYVYSLTSTLQIWDTSGSPRFENLLFSYCRHSQGAVLFFDTTNRASFANVDKWLAFFRRENVLGPDRTKLLLVGTKCDSPQRVIASTEAIDFARKHSLLYAEYDARSNRQRDTCEVLEPLVSKMIDAHKFDSLTLDDDSKAKQSVFAPVNAAFKQFCNKYFSCGSPIQS